MRELKEEGRIPRVERNRVAGADLIVVVAPEAEGGHTVEHRNRWGDHLLRQVVVLCPRVTRA
jgi:NAD(P)H-dependent flavin oxidoreductase YrpB (nitropropane dioxygenase family)